MFSTCVNLAFANHVLCLNSDSQYFHCPVRWGEIRLVKSDEGYCTSHRDTNATCAILGHMIQESSQCGIEFARPRIFKPVHIIHTSSSQAVDSFLENSKITMRMKGPFASQIPLLIGIEVLIIVSFVLSILALSAGNSTKYHGQSATLTVNSTQVFEPSWVPILTVWVVQYLLPARHFAEQQGYRRLVRNELSISLLWDVECRCCQW